MSGRKKEALELRLGGNVNQKVCTLFDKKVHLVEFSKSQIQLRE